MNNFFYNETKKFLLATIFMVGLFACPFVVSAENTKSVDLEKDNSQYLSITDAAQTGLDLSSAFTFEMWIKPESTPAGGSGYGLISKADSYNASASYHWWYEQADGKLYLQLTNGSANDAKGQAFTLTTGSWTHIAITWDGGSKSFKWYQNGVQLGTTQTGSNVAAVADSAVSFAIGTGQFRNQFFFDGLIDDVRVWNIVRSESEIADNMETELVGNESGLVAYWKLNDDLLDATSNNNDLTNNNSATFSSDVPFAGGEPPAPPATPTPPVYLAGLAGFTQRYENALVYIGVSLLLLALILSVAHVGKAVLQYTRREF